MPNVVFFEICVDDLKAAADFYSRVFGWEIEEDVDDVDSWTIASGKVKESGIAGALTTRYNELDSTINTIEVPSLEECGKQITEAGGQVLAPPSEIPGVGHLQYCHDPEGNAFAILQSKPNSPSGSRQSSSKTVGGQGTRQSSSKAVGGRGTRQSSSKAVGGRGTRQ
jgi:predicted enzyme related to lactoylglutathione lyase